MGETGQNRLLDTRSFEKWETIISLRNGSRNTQTQTGRLERRTLLNQRYMIMRTIGQGGMGAVYQARDLRRQTICAVKEMSLSMVPPDERTQAVQNFKAEAKMLAGMNHPNLPTFSDFFTEGPRHFLVMEYIDGLTLEDYLERNNAPFPERRVLGWARQLCNVLIYLHNQQPPIIFRDLKPGNIMLTHNGRIKLIDFGIARFFRHSSSQDTQLLGTPGFAPPEQYGKAQTDTRSDIYSLAITLFQLMTNRLSEKGFGLQDVNLINPQISLHVARALEKATALSPDDRFQSVEAFRQALFGEGTFMFENGEQATTPEELADLCARFPEEAADYVFAGEIEAWLQEIGETELARAAKQIRVSASDSEEAVEQFLKVVPGPNVRMRGNTGKYAVKSSQTGKQIPMIHPTEAIPRDNRTWLSREPRRFSPEIIVQPLMIDFGEVEAGLSEAKALSIIGDRSTFMQGTITATEPWILIDTTSFDGLSTRVNVQVNTARLQPSRHYTGTILVAPNDDEEQEIEVMVEVDVLDRIRALAGASSVNMINGQSRQGQSPGTALEDEEEENDTMTASASGMMMAPRAAASTGSAIDPARYKEYKEKYGEPVGGSNSAPGGWNLLQASPVQRLWVQRGLTVFAAFMLASLCYTLISGTPFTAHSSIFPPNLWFIVVLLAIVPAATLGALVVNWKPTWSAIESISRLCTGLSTAFLALGSSEFAWQYFFHPNVPSIQLFVMLLVTALGSTVGIHSGVSEMIIKWITPPVEYVRWLVITAAVLIGGIVGLAMTVGFPLSLLTPFSMLVGCSFLLALVMWVDYLLKQNNP